MLALGALALVAAAAAVILFVRGAEPAGPEEALDPFVAAWTRGDDAGRGARDRPPGAAAATSRRTGEGSTARRSGPGWWPSTRRRHGERGDRVAWDVPGIGRFAYHSAARSAGRGRLDDRVDPEGDPPAAEPPPGAWARRASRPPAATSSTATAPRSCAPRTVYRVGLQRDKVNDVDASVAALARRASTSTAGARPGGARRRARSSSSRRITLREADYAA